VASDDVWAVGTRTSLGTAQPLIQYWDGTAWTNATFRLPEENLLYSVVALTSGNVWAVGQRGEVADDYPLTAHWDGTKWRAIPGDAPSGEGHLFDVTAVSPTELWAVGGTEIDLANQPHAERSRGCQP
jgi:hypothetical protein